VQNSIHQNLAIAIHYLEIDEVDSSLYFINAILDKKAKHEEALFIRARIFNNRQAYEKALVDYNAIIAISDSNKEAFYARGLVLYQLKQYDLAIEDFEQTLNMPNKPTETAFFKMEPQQGASGILTMATLDAEIYNSLGLCQIETEDFNGAIETFNQGLAVDQKNLDLLVNRARAYEKIGNINLAINDLEQVMKENSRHAIASINLIRMKKQMNNGSDYLASLNRFVLENPNNAEGYLSRGIYFYENMFFESALLDFEEASSQDPDNIDYQFNLGLCYSKLNQLKDAEETFSTVIEKNPNHSGAYFNLGNLKFKAESYEDAIAYYTIAHHKTPQNPLILYNRALAYGELAQYDNACKDITEARLIDAKLGERFFQKFCNQKQ
jgi:tetratricopeptide (TPR) repeat protein